MFRNQYDNDVTVWSPQGRIHQVEYAMEAVKQGSATIGLKSKTHAVIVALKRASSELSAYQKKIIPIDTHMGMTIAGLTADARFLSRYMRSECLNHRFSYDEPHPVSTLISKLGNKLQVCTQSYDRRPYGVGLLVAGYDVILNKLTTYFISYINLLVIISIQDKGPHIYQTCPSATYFDCKAMAIGARSQSARTYLEKHLNEFLDCTNEDLVRHGLRALRDTLPNEVELTSRNVSVGVVGKGMDFTIYDNEHVEAFLAGLEGEERRGGRPLPPAVDQDLKEDPVGESPAPAVEPVPSIEMDVAEHGAD